MYDSAIYVRERVHRLEEVFEARPWRNTTTQRANRLPQFRRIVFNETEPLNIKIYRLQKDYRQYLDGISFANHSYFEPKLKTVLQNG